MNAAAWIGFARLSGEISLLQVGKDDKQLPAYPYIVIVSYIFEYVLKHIYIP